MKKLLTAALFTLLGAVATQAQTVVLDYNMALTPDQQGFTLIGSCPSPWSVADGILKHRGCLGAAMASHDNLLVGAATVQVDARMRVLEGNPTGYVFEFMLGRELHACYCQLKASDFGDTNWHDLTLFYNYGTYAFSAYLDGNPVSLDHLWQGASAFIIGDGNPVATWGSVDFSSLKVTVDYEQAVVSETATWGGIKGLYR